MIAKTLRSNLNALVDAYARATGNKLETISKKFYGNKTFFRAFRARKCTLSIDKYGKVVEKFRDDWPEQAKWPSNLREVAISPPERDIPNPP